MERFRTNKKAIIVSALNNKGKITYMFIKAGKALVDKNNNIVSFEAEVDSETKEQRFDLLPKNLKLAETVSTVKDGAMLLSGVFLARNAWQAQHKKKKPDIKEHTLEQAEAEALKGSMIGMSIGYVLDLLEKRINASNLCYRLRSTNEIAFTGVIKANSKDLD